MRTGVSPAQRQAAKREIVRQIEQGISAQVARVQSAVPMHRTTVYRLLKRVQTQGERGLSDGRQGHAVKLRGERLAVLIQSCQETPSVPSSAIQRILEERFGDVPSVSQLNRVRARLGLTRQPVPREKKAENGPHDPLRRA